ncbi:alpha/beta hydrolase family protein [Solirubrobacter soli]|uniref:alpha/beta hydrolase family protein n=1 Tax=Solirubrobacter soli TaxID=363832 RepID=UPI00056C1CD4|nr:alpha/beta family hydrolase [Solirubrobacter soli]
MIELETPHGPARAHVNEAEAPVGVLVLGHGAGGGVGAPDLKAATEAALAVNVTTILVEQPYRVAGRKSAAPAAQLDTAWKAVIEQLPIEGLPLYVGGRSSGARVACRTSGAVGATGVLCLAFPLHPPGRPEKTRLPELEQVTVPVLIIQGESDPFGMPPEAPNRTVVRLKGNHSLKSDVRGLRAAVTSFLAGSDDDAVD